MATLIITGKLLSDGTIGNDSGDLNRYTELGWELMINRIYVIHLLNSGEVNRNDIIATHPDRVCLYSNIFNNINNENKAQYNKVIDIVSMCQKLPISFTPKWQHWDRDINTILSIQYSPFHPDHDLIGIAVRLRDWNSHLNLTKEYWSNIINYFTERNIHCYVFGKGAEILTDNKKSHHVNLQQWCTIMHHPRCKMVIGSLSGAMIVGQLCCTNKMIIIDTEKKMREPNLQNHPLFYGNCVNFSGVPIKFLEHMAQASEIHAYL